jgi:hypothetical protein
MLKEIYRDVDTLEDIKTLITDAIKDEPPATVREGGIIRDGYNEELDFLRDTMTGSTNILHDIEAREREKTGIKSLKVGFNKVFGYYIEVTKSNYDQVPAHYVRKQTLANCERYITDELKHLEDLVLRSDEKIVAKEYRIFCGVRERIREEIKRIQRETGITTVFVTHDQEEAMSICDTIVVMKLGVVQQVDAPQKVYDNPANLFVAKFLGTPPINVFKGELKDGKVYIGEEVIAEFEGEDQPLWVGIRPEGFIVDENGPFSLTVDHVEVMGREKSIIATHACSEEKKNVRIIVEEAPSLNNGDTVRVSLKPNKVFLFNGETEERL